MSASAPASGRRGSSFLSASILVLLASITGAQNARVVSCNSSNGQILDVDFDSLTTTLLASDNSRVTMQSCAFRDDGAAGVHLIVADRNGEVVFFENGVGPGQILLAIDPANPSSPNGLSLDPAHNLYGVSSSTGSSAGSDAVVWMVARDPAGSLAGGYAGPVAYIDSQLPGVELLAETILVTSNRGELVAGDLLVLASDPPQILRYRSSELATFRQELAAGLTPAELVPDVFVHPAGAAVPAGERFPDGVTPGGMDLTQDGSLLVSVSEGTILHFQADGTRKTDGLGGFVDFYTGLGNGQFKLATGLQDGALRVFLTDRNGGEVHRFGFAGDGTGVLEATITDPESPNGIATTTAATQVTPAGTGVLVTSSNLMESAIEAVPVAGVTGITEYVFADPRELEPGAPADPSAPLHRSLDLNQEVSSLLPAGVTLPPYCRGFRRLDPVSGLPTGEPTLIVLVASSSAQVQGTIQHIADEAIILGYKPDCADPDPTMRPKLFWRDNPAAGEPPVPEGDFVNVTNGCGTSRGLTMHFSIFVPARDTRTSLEIAGAQIDGLGLVIEGASCIRSKTLNTIERHYQTARREFFDRLRPDKALKALQTLQEVIDSAPSRDLSGCAENEGGSIEARVGAVIYTLENL